MSIRKRPITLAHIFSSAWFVRPDFAQGYFPHVLRMMKGEEPESIVDGDLSYGETQSWLTPDPCANSISVFRVSEYGRDSAPEKAPRNSVAVIPLCGLMTKYDQYCGPSGTETKADLLQRCYEHPNIVAVVFEVDSGGGQYSEKLNALAKSQQKPVIAFVNGFACSAAQGFISNCKEVFVNGKMSTLGSIGSYIEAVDFTEYYAKQGIEVLRVYAPQSTEKNKAFEALLTGDNKPLKEELRKYTQIFIDSVKENRPQIKDDGLVFKGKHYLSEDAIAIGLADKIGNIDDAIIRAHELAGQKTNSKISGSKNQSQSQNTMLNMLPKVCALKGKKSEELTEESLEIANAELVTEGINTVQLVSKTDYSKLQSDATAAAAKITALETEKTALEAKVTKLENEDGADPVTGKKEKDDITDDPAKQAATKMNELSHNKAADEMLPATSKS